MSVKLSHTSKEKYLLSPRAYYLHYNLYLREEVLGSPLFFGTLIEKGLEALFQGATLEQALQTFRRNFKTYSINGNTVDLSSSPWVRYSKSDLDLEIFSESELKGLETKSDKFKSWASLQKKGEMLIEAYNKEIMPKIKKVIATQLPFTIENEVGDQITGFADALIEWEDGRLIMPDHKTSSMPIKEVVKNKGYNKQVTVYFDAFKDKYPIDATGFIVLEKKMRKKDPRARVDFEFITPTEEFTNKTLDEYDEVLYGIKNAEFPCFSPKCDQYGQECCYKKFCESGGKDMTGLVKVGKK